MDNTNLEVSPRQKTYDKIFIDGILMSVHVGGWSGANELSPEDLGFTKEDIAEMISLGKKDLIPPEVSKAFTQVENKGRNLVKRNAFPFSIGNSDFVPKTRFKEVVEGLRECQAKYMELADDLVAKYPEYRQQMMPKWVEVAEKVFERINPPLLEFGIDGDPEAIRLHREEEKAEYVGKFLDRIISQYPPAETLRKKFYFTWDVYQIAAPEMQMTTVEDVLQSEEAQQSAKLEAQRQMSEKINGFVSEVVTTLRQETAVICNRIATAIKSGKVIKSTTVNSLRNFIERFKDMNFVGDKSISDQLDAVQRDFLDAHQVETITGSLDLQTELADKLSLVAAEASKITEMDIDGITGEYVRVVDWQ